MDALSPVVNAGNALIGFAFLEHHASGAGVGKDMTANGLDHRTLVVDAGHNPTQKLMGPNPTFSQSALNGSVFSGALTNIDMAPGSAMHWLMTTTAILNSSAIRVSSLKC